MFRRAGAIVVFLFVSLLASVAGAESAADIAAARELFKEAAALSKEGRWEEAKDRLLRSLALKKAPITYYSLGVAQHRTGDLVEALESFRAFLIAPREPATDRYRKAVEAAVMELEQRVAEVNIVVKPEGLEGLELTLDGASVPIAALDRARLVNPGEHVLVAAAPGHHEARRSFELGEGEQAEVTLTLQPAPAATSAPAPIEPAAPSPPAPDQEAEFPVGPVVLMVGGAAALAAGLAVGLIGLEEAKESPTHDGSDADAARTKGIVGDVLAGAGGVAAGIGLIWLIVHVTSEPEPSEQARALEPWADGPVTGLRARF